MPQPIHLKDHEKDARLVRRRVIVGAVAVVLLTLVLVARMYHLQVTQYEYHSTLSENNRVHVQPIPPTRGIIFDRNGVIIADNRPSFSLTITRERTEDLQKTLDTLVEILGLTEDDRAIFEKRMKQGRRPFEPVPIMFELNEEQIARIAVNQFRLPGVDVATQFVRHYPLKEHFAHSVGYVGRINEQELKNLDPINYSGTHHIGKTGIERFYESELHGTVGYEEVETNARGRVLRVLKRTDPIPGKDIVLSIDSRLQEAAENALAGRRGAIVAIQPSTGDVLAMVSQPSYDPNLFVTGISFKAYAELRDSIDRPLYNRVLRGLYPPGSTVKPAVALAGLDAGVVTPTSRVFDPGYYQLPNYDHKYRNWNRYGDGWVSLESAIYRSNDTYFYDLAHKLGIDRLHAFMSRFGFGQKVALDMFGEADGLMPLARMEAQDPPPGLVPGRDPDPRHRPGLHAGDADPTGADDRAAGQQGPLDPPAPGQDHRRPAAGRPRPDARHRAARPGQLGTASTTACSRWCMAPAARRARSAPPRPT